MGIKTKIKKLLSRKEYMHIFHPVSSNKEFRGKVALISGGTGGIGLAIAKSLFESEFTVIKAGTNEKKMDSIQKKMGFDTIIMDYFNPKSFEEVISTIVMKYGKLDIFINSAGVHTENVDFWAMDPDEFDRIMNVNLKGTFFACQSVGKYMKNNKIKGKILLVSSSRGSEPAWSPYGIS